MSAGENTMYGKITDPRQQISLPPCRTVTRTANNLSSVTQLLLPGITAKFEQNREPDNGNYEVSFFNRR